jgi:pyrroloquinoline quinone biosynthesis protein D
MPDLSDGSAQLFNRPCLAKRVRLQIDPVSGKPVLLNQEAVILLNRTGYEILEQCDGTRTLTEIIEELGNRYAIAKTTLTQDVSQYVEKLNQKGLLQWI